jgi:hypothetical protein
MFAKVSFLTTKRKYSYQLSEWVDKEYEYWWVEVPSGGKKIVKICDVFPDEEYQGFKGSETVASLKPLFAPFHPELEIERLGPSILTENVEVANETIQLLGTDVDEYVRKYNKGEIPNV